MGLQLPEPAAKPVCGSLCFPPPGRLAWALLRDGVAGPSMGSVVRVGEARRTTGASSSCSSGKGLLSLILFAIGLEGAMGVPQTDVSLKVDFNTVDRAAVF